MPKYVICTSCHGYSVFFHFRGPPRNKIERACRDSIEFSRVSVTAQVSQSIGILLTHQLVSQQILFKINFIYFGVLYLILAVALLILTMGGSASKETICINGSDNKAIENTKIDNSSHLSFIDCSNQHGGFLIIAFVLLLVIFGVILYVFKKRWGLLSSTCRSCRGENRTHLKQQNLLKDLNRAQITQLGNLSNTQLVSPVVAPDFHQVGFDLLYIIIVFVFNTIFSFQLRRLLSK